MSKAIIAMSSIFVLVLGLAVNNIHASEEGGPCCGHLVFPRRTLNGPDYCDGRGQCDALCCQCENGCRGNPVEGPELLERRALAKLIGEIPASGEFPAIVEERSVEEFPAQERSVEEFPAQERSVEDTQETRRRRVVLN